MIQWTEIARAGTIQIAVTRRRGEHGILQFLKYKEIRTGIRLLDLNYERFRGLGRLGREAKEHQTLESLGSCKPIKLVTGYYCA